VDKSILAEGGPLPFFWAAYELARVQAVTAVRREACGKLDMEAVQEHIDGIAGLVPCLGEMARAALQEIGEDFAGAGAETVAARVAAEQVVGGPGDLALPVDHGVARGVAGDGVGEARRLPCTARSPIYPVLMRGGFR
jgi:hypothetical protein